MEWTPITSRLERDADETETADMIMYKATLETVPGLYVVNVLRAYSAMSTTQTPMTSDTYFKDHTERMAFVFSHF